MQICEEIGEGQLIIGKLHLFEIDNAMYRVLNETMHYVDSDKFVAEANKFFVKYDKLVEIVFKLEDQIKLQKKMIGDFEAEDSSYISRSESLIAKIEDLHNEIKELKKVQEELNNKVYDIELKIKYPGSD